MTLHYSVRYKNERIPYHGEVYFPVNISNGYESYYDLMTRTARIALLKSQIEWGKKSHDVVRIEFYYQQENKDIVFFKWENKEKDL